MQLLRQFGRKAASLEPPLLAIALGFGSSLHCSSTGKLTGGAGQSSIGGAPAGVAGAAGAENCESAPTDIYHDRIEPLLSADTPKSCNQCHLSGVDLAAFVRATPCETMACLVEDGLVDPEAPADSKILSFIRRASPDSELITVEVIQSEYDGFLQWIEASASCPSACAGVICNGTQAAPKCPPTPVPSEPTEPLPDVLGPAECADTALEQLFYDNVYAWRARCFPCHFSDQLKAAPTAPRWLRVEGNCAQSSLATYRRITSGDFLNLDEPTQSLLLLKPLAIAAGGVKHGGHDKFDDTSDPAYQGFLRFIEQYAGCRREMSSR